VVILTPKINSIHYSTSFSYRLQTTLSANSTEKLQIFIFEPLLTE